MTTFITDNLYFYLALLAGIILCLYLSKKIAKSGSSYFITVANKLLLFTALTLAITGVFSWRLNQSASLNLNLDTWLISLDITLAHLLFTLPVAMVSYSLFTRVFQWIWQVISGIYEFLISALKIEKDLEKLGDEIGKLLAKSVNTFFSFVILIIWAIFYDFTIPALSIFAAYWTSQLLFVDTTDLQTFVIGAFDNLLGWNYPTIYKFTSIVEHWQMIFQVLVGKKEVATILSFLGLVGSGILGFAALIDAIEKIGKHGRK
ncbi:MAG: hypothetical protein HS124_06850 [Anaerolineales bacterium]|nr:hypothetical protein [Anaerolineales bacterium]